MKSISCFHALNLFPIAAVGVLAELSAGLVGIQQDEALFVRAVYQPSEFPNTTLHGILNGRVVLVLAPYAGSLKAWLYAPYLSWTPFTAVWFRLPMVALLMAVAAGMALLWRRQAAAPIVLAAMTIAFLHPALVLATVMD